MALIMLVCAGYQSWVFHLFIFLILRTDVMSMSKIIMLLCVELPT